MSENIHEMK